MARKTSIVVADDHPVVQEGVVARLKGHGGLRVVAAVANFVELWEVLGSTQTDVVILDIGNMGAPPIVTVQRLVRTYPQLAIIIFSSSVDLAPELLRAGARGYIVKEEVMEYLHTAIEVTVGGEIFISPQAQEYLGRCIARPTTNRLTHQELNVLRQLALGQSSQEVAETLAIDASTVYNYVLRLKTKTGCQDRIQLVDWYRRVYGTT